MGGPSGVARKKLDGAANAALGKPVDAGTRALAALTPQEIAVLAAEQNPAAKVMASVMPVAPAGADRKPEFSVITCSINDERFNAMAATYQIALAGEDFEIIRVNDAKSLAEGYTRGVAAARGSIVIFSHDDAAPIRPIGSRLRRHLRVCDVVGGAGTNRLDGPAWFTAGPPHVFGQVLNRIPNQRDLLLTVYGVPSALVEGIQAFDGFWFAANRHVLDEVQFDAEMCDGFHQYDVDFSYRAYLRGVRIGIATDLSLTHASVGGYGDAKWKPAADKWMAKYGPLLPSHKPHGFQFAAVSGADPNAMLAVMDDLVEATR